jgi:type IV pilus assembly protein PilN
MIKINLLPIRAARKKETAKQQVIIFVFSVLGVVIIALAIYFMINMKIVSTKNEISRSESEIQELKAKIGKINDLKKLQQEVRKKLDVLILLRKGKVGPVHRLLTLSDSAPDKLWLTKYAENGNDVSISGVAFNEELLAEYMRNLEASPDYETVELIVSEQMDMKGIKVKKFDIKLRLEAPKISEPSKSVKK